MIMNKTIKILIVIIFALSFFSFSNSAKADFLMSTSTPCGVRLTWNSTGANKSKCIDVEDGICENFSNKKAYVKIKRSQVYSTDTNSWPTIFEGMVSAVPTDYIDNNDYLSFEYIYGSNYASYTDLTAIPGNTYYYEVKAYDPSPSYPGNESSLLKTFSSQLQLQFDSSINYKGITFQRPQLNYYSNLYGYVNDIGATASITNPYYTQTGMSYEELLAEYGSQFSNSCPFVQVPGDSKESGIFSILNEPGGSKISDLTCNENKYAFATSTTGLFFENSDSPDDMFDIIQRYGFSDDKFYSPDNSLNYVSNTIQSTSKYGDSISKYGDVWNIITGYNIYKTGSVGFNFYREVCKESQVWTFDTICTFSKVPTTEYTLTQPRAGYNVVEFNNNYIPPPDTDDYLVEVRYRVTAVNKYGAESWPVEFQDVSPLLTCLNDCIDPNTISSTTPFTIKNKYSKKFLGWNSSDSALGQFFSSSSPDRLWYIKPSNESKYAILASSDGMALSTDGYIDWSWDHFGESLYNPLFTEDYYVGYIFPGYIKKYEFINEYKGEIPWRNVGGEFTIGYKIKKEKIYDPSDDSQKWCIAPEKKGEWHYDEESDSTDYTMVNTGNYAFINKNVQTPMKLLNLDYSDPLKNTEGFLVWLDPFEDGYTINNTRKSEHSPGLFDPVALWQLDTPTTTTLQSCLLPNGSTIPDSATTTYWKSSRFNGDCDNNKEIRTCTNGTLTGTATSTSCTEYCVNPIDGDDINLGSTYSTTTEVTKECKKNTYKYTCTDKEDGQGAKMVLQTPVNSTNIEGCTPVDDNPEPKTLNTARLVPSIVDIGKQCFGRIDTVNDLGYLSLISSTTTCGIYGILDTSYQTALGDGKDPASSDLPGVDPGKDYKIVCKDKTIEPKPVTAISRTLKCALNPSVREI